MTVREFHAHLLSTPTLGPNMIGPEENFENYSSQFGGKPHLWALQCIEKYCPIMKRITEFVI